MYASGLKISEKRRLDLEKENAIDDVISETGI